MMNGDYFLCAGLLILAVSAVCAARLGKGIVGWVRCLGVGVVLANIVLLLPLPLFEGKSSIELSILSALQASALNASYDDLLGIVLREGVGGQSGPAFSAFYLHTLSVMFVISPLLLLGYALTFFKRAAQRCAFFIYALFRDVYCFSELNHRSMMLAGSVCRHGRFLVVFCGVSADNRFTEDAQKQGYIVFPESEHRVKLRGTRRWSFFEIADDMTGNLVGTRNLIERYSKERRKDRISIYLFSNQDEAEILLDATDKKGFSVTVINEPSTVAYNLMFDLPLYNALQTTGDKKLSVMVVGAGKIGFEIIKATAWCGQMDGVSLEITVIDQEAAFKERQFRMECPELMCAEYGIRFLTADVRTDALERLLIGLDRNINYIAVCLGNDELGIRTALFLRGHYLRNSADFCREPFICCQVSTETRAANIRELTAVSRKKLAEENWDFSSKNAQNFNIHPFGSYERMYSYDTIVHSAIESLALNVNTLYDHVMGVKNNAAQMLYSYHVSEVNKRSNRANAVHLQYKLYGLGFEMIAADTPTPEDMEAHENSLNALRELLMDQALIERLSMVEHNRWNAFQRSEGYRGATIEQASSFRLHPNGSHIHRRAKMHACICGWDELKEVAEIYDKRIISYDEELIRNIPIIIGAEPNARMNLGGLTYLLRARSEMHETDSITRVLPRSGSQSA